MTYTLCFLIDNRPQIMCYIEPSKIKEWSNIATIFTKRLRDVVSGSAEASVYTEYYSVHEFDPNIALYSDDNYPRIEVLQCVNGKITYGDTVYEDVYVWTHSELSNFCICKYNAYELTLGLSKFPFLL